MVEHTIRSATEADLEDLGRMAGALVRFHHALDPLRFFLLARGAPRLVLATAVQNLEAQRLFEAHGFRRTMIEMARELD
jgi:RimJ/RimL family protein N-acetyltransferase